MKVSSATLKNVVYRIFDIHLRNFSKNAVVLLKIFHDEIYYVYLFIHLRHLMKQNERSTNTKRYTRDETVSTEQGICIPAKIDKQ